MQLFARDVMSLNPVVIHPEMTCQEAADFLIENNITGAPVVDNRGVLMGVLTIKDLLKAELDIPYALDYFKVSERLFNENGYQMERYDGFITDYMSRQVFTATPDTPVAKLAKDMMERQIHRIIIVEPDEEKPIGIVSTFDLLQVIAETGVGQRPQPVLS